MSYELRIGIAVALIVGTGCGAPPPPAPPSAVEIGPGKHDAPKTIPAADAEASRPLPPAPALTATELAELDALLLRLRDAQTAEQPALLEAVVDRFGGRGLVRALSRWAPTSSPDKPEVRWFRTEQIMGMLERRADPAAADDLFVYIGRTSDEHFRGRAAMLLAQLGDVRAAEPLARRIRIPPDRIYAPERFWESGSSGHLSRTDEARIGAARALADLVKLHPAERERLARVAEDAVVAWLDSQVYPHANGMRFLGRVRSDRGRALLRKWALPTDPLPAHDASPPFPAAFEIAQSSLRYLGATGDPAVRTDLEGQLFRKDPALDISQEALVAQPSAMHGMVLRALGYGAAQGLSELGDERAVPSLDRVVRDPLQHEDVRAEACEAIAHLTPEGGLSALVTELQDGARHLDRDVRFRAECLLRALTQRVPPTLPDSIVADLSHLDAPAIELAALLAVSGVGGRDDAIAAELQGEAMPPLAAAIAILGGSERAAAAAGKTAATQQAEARLTEILAVIRPSDAHLSRGTLLRWGRNLRAAGRPKWATEPLERYFENTQFDNGPHSLTRVVLRRRLLEIAVFGSFDERADAKEVLSLMREQGALDYLGRLP